MGLISIFLLIVFVIVSLLTMLVVLIQDDQGEGIAGMFGGASTTPFGSRSGNVLTRFTSIMGAIFLFAAFSLAWLNRTPESADILEKARIERLQKSESTDWWVEKIEQPASPQAEAEAAPVQNEEPAANP